MMKGIVAAPGMALAPAYIVSEPERAIPKLTIKDVPEELGRFRCATAVCRSQIETIMADLEGAADPQTIEILDFQLLLLEDTSYTGDIEGIISDRKVNAEYAVKSASAKYISRIESFTDNDYLRERTADISDLSQRLISVLSGVSTVIAEPDGPYIAIGRDIAPSRVAELNKAKLTGIVLEKGGITSHCVIISRSLGIPCLIETRGVLDAVEPGDTILLDAVSGEAVPFPDSARIKSYNEYVENEKIQKVILGEYKDRRSETLDGATMKVFANITMSTESDNVMQQGGEGVGLFRSELLYMSQPDRPPSEEKQYHEYARAAKTLDGRPLIIRTLDIGGDKQINYMDIGREDNPFLGYRAIRYCIDHPEVFMPQISAILRAGAVGNVLMMFPMISCKSELIAAKQIVAHVGAELRAKGIQYDSAMKIGMMVETPAAAADAGIFAKEADFFSIGTNDLSQYLFAADRANAKVTNLISWFQPTLLRVIDRVVAAAKSGGIEVDICGQAAEINALVPVWLAMGVDNLSVSIPRITAVRRRICTLNRSDCVKLADDVLALDSAEEVERTLADFDERNAVYDSKTI